MAQVTPNDETRSITLLRWQKRDAERSQEKSSMAKYYNIVARDIAGTGVFRLFNEAAGMAPCGDRLFKGEDNKDPKQQWPFKPGEDWTRYTNQADADMAAKKLQDYLEARQRNKAKEKKGKN